MKEIFYDWFGYNVEIFHILNHIGNAEILPRMLKGLSELFNIENFAIYYLLLCFFGYRRILYNKGNFSVTYNTLVGTGICYAVFGLIYAALKFSVNLPRPFCSLPPESFETIINTSAERCMSSFPSSHAGIALMVTILAWSYMSRSARIAGVLIVVGVAFSRITLAMHYPADIFYSWIIVFIVLFLSRMIFKLFERNVIKYVGQWLSNIC